MRTVLVDAMNLCYRVAHVPAFFGLTNPSGISTGIMHGFLYSLLLFAHHTDKVIVVWDSRSKRKREIYPKYKANREEKDVIGQAIVDSVQVQITPLRRLLHLMGIDQYKCLGYEVDEIIGTLASMTVPFDMEIVIVSEDKDFLQLVCKDRNIWQPIKKRIVNLENFKKLYMGLTPSEYFYFRQLTGDVSDNIDGVPGCGEKTALEIVENYRKGYKHTFNGILAQKLLKKITSLKIKDITEINETLMILNEESIPTKELINGFQSGHSEGKVRARRMFEVYGLNKVMEVWGR